MLLVLAAGVALRCVRWDDPPLAYQATRQYNDALLARKYEQALGGDAAGVRRAVVRTAAPKEIEPPLLEAVTAVVWRLSGSEPLWFPRALAILAWSVGGWFLFCLLTRLASPFAGIAGVVVWSFLPFATTVSRSFQPDPLMVAAMAGAVLALVVHDDEPNRRRLVVAGLAAGFAILVKAPAVFFVAAVFLALAWRRGGWRGVTSRASILFAVLALTPAALYHVYGFWIGGFLGGQEGSRFVPSLLVHLSFWRRWAHLGVRSFGLVVPVVALVGLAAARGRARVVAWALCAGYVVFGLVFTFHYSTHDYYHLPLVLVVAVGVGLLVDRVLTDTRDRHGHGAARGAMVVIALVVVAGFQSGVFPVVPAAIPDATRVVELEAPRAIGRLVGHSRRVMFVAPSFGNTLMFYGGLAGDAWRDDDDPAARLGPGAEHRFDFFVVTDRERWRELPALRRYLERYAERLADSPRFIVFDLREG